MEHGQANAIRVGPDRNYITSSGPSQGTSLICSKQGSRSLCPDGSLLRAVPSIKLTIALGRDIYVLTMDSGIYVLQ